MAITVDGIEYWSYAEAAAYLGCSRKTIYNAVADGRLPDASRPRSVSMHGVRRFLRAQDVRSARAMVPPAETPAP